ncbi:uncharacterized protein PG998_008482 [Apiospora kogelbergensis]|uniref:uncharacterized protein n=1 Tax=Apiospora kogelbergensis TaxID=1337665 RepID=UPI00312FF137
MGSGRHAGEEEVSGVNQHTRDVEFYGSSSSVALLSHVHRTSQSQDDEDADVLSSLHNPAFRPAGDRSHGEVTPLGQISHYPHCWGFLDSFFSTIHFVHPILDKRSFFERCERELWSSTESAAAFSSFTALYYSILSLGALVGVREDEPLEGRSNLQWSRKFFDEAKRYCNLLGMVTDLEMVQCYFIMAKVCQNELNAHWSYMYVGLAVRTALAIGINREPGPTTERNAARLKEESRTWWGLYSLETEMSFAMGRPDTLGADLFHNRRLPLVQGQDADVTIADNPDLLEPPHCSIIRFMVDFSRITRSVCQRVYLVNTTVPEAVTVAYQIENDLNQWVEALPKTIAPVLSTGPATSSLKGAKAAPWIKRQKLVLNIRYHNLTILLFGSLLIRSSASERASIPGCTQAVRKCLDSAKQTISIIYQTYEHNDFFRTWFYNTTYTVFAASIILVYVNQEHLESEVLPLLQVVDMAVEILEAMDECVVAMQAAKLLHRARVRAEKRFSVTTEPSPNPELLGSEGAIPLSQYWGPLGLLDGEMDLDFAFQLGAFDGSSAMFMPLNDQSMLQESGHDVT